jgi:hypothetical protein
MLENKQLLWLILLVNLILSLLYLLSSGELWFVPRHEYTQLAVNLAAGRGYCGSGFFRVGFGPSAFLGPVYTIFLAALIALFKLPQIGRAHV